MNQGKPSGLPFFLFGSVRLYPQAEKKVAVFLCTSRLRLGINLLAGLCALPAVAVADVTVRGHEIRVDGRPFPVRGACVERRLDGLAELGANTVRTYGGDPGPVLDAARRLNLKVIAGLWLEPPRRGFDYRNRALVEAQLASFRAIVTRYRDHPALLAWGIGNEVEAELPDASLVWPAIGEAARLVKTLDPAHPTVAVLAEAGGDKIRKIREQAPDIDVLGVNTYGDAALSLTERVRSEGWTGPILVTELGAVGQWQAPATPWGAPVEPSSTEKAARLARYLAALRPGTAGQIVFLWGQKQEVTPTWHGLLLASGEWLQTSEAMAAVWGGTTPGGNRAPRIAALHLEGGPAVGQGKPIDAALDFGDPDGDPVHVYWSIMAESTDRKKGGDRESVPPDHSGALRDTGPRSVRIVGLPPGTYRLFAVVRDGLGAAATANVPFRID